MRIFNIYLLLLATFVAVVYSSSLKTQSCPRALATSADSVAVNQLQRDPTKPLFRLDFTQQKLNPGRKDERQAYRVHLRSPHVAFDRVKLSIETNGSCGVGSFEFEPNDFPTVIRPDKSCQVIYLESRKHTTKELPPLVWTPPICGCVLIRAVVEDGSVSYTEDDKVQNGPLARLVCIKKASRNQRLDALCENLDRYLTTEIISGDFFLTRHQLQQGIVDKFQLDLALKLRRSDARVCCRESQEKRMSCFEDSRWRRVDQFCDDGIPDLPFTQLRRFHMREREEECCPILGEHRYTCFAKNDKAGQDISGATPLDYSLDETDPVNDLAEFACEKDQDLISSLTPPNFDIGENFVTTSITEKKHNPPETSNHDNTDHRKEDATLPRGHSDKTDYKPNKKTASPTKHHKTEDATTQTSQKHSSRDGQRHSDVLGGRKVGVTNLEPSKQPERFTDVKTGKADRKTHGAQRDKQFHNGLVSDHYSDRDIDDVYTDEERDALLMGWSKHPVDPVVDLPRIPPRKSPVQRPSTNRKQKANGNSQRRRGSAQFRYEDQGAASLRTLNKLEKKMRRFRLKHRCCSSGAGAGESVYGTFRHAWKECSHSFDKLMDRLDLPYGHKMCEDQFKKCCLETSVSGPAMTSQEFRDAEYNYLESVYGTGSYGKPPQDSQRDGKGAGGPRDQMQSYQYLDKGSPDAYDLGAEIRFDGMRDVPEDGLPYDEEYNGPVRFDELDNNFVRSRKEDTETDVVGHIRPKKKGGKKYAVRAETSEEDGDNEKNNDDDDSEEKEDEDEKFERELGFSDKEALTGKITTRKDTQVANREKPAKEQDITDYDAVAFRQIAQPEKKHQSSKKRNSGSRDRSVKRGRSRSRSSRTSRRKGSRRSSRRSSRSSRQRRHRHSRPHYRQPTRFHTYGAVAAKDSQEMADSNAKRFAGVMDSKEQLEAFSHSPRFRQRKS